MDSRPIAIPSFPRKRESTPYRQTGSNHNPARPNPFILSLSQDERMEGGRRSLYAQAIPHRHTIAPTVIPAQAGIQNPGGWCGGVWIPAFAGMTGIGWE